MLVFVVRGRQPAFRWTLLGAVALIVAHVIWWLWVNPANIALRQLSLDNPPADWLRLRDQWEYTHLVRFFIQLAGFVLQLVSVLVETPAGPLPMVAAQKQSRAR